MTAYVALLSPDLDVDLQRNAIRDKLNVEGGQVVEWHIGGARVAEATARALNAPLLVVEALDKLVVQEWEEKEKGNVTARRRKARSRYEAAKPKLREAQLLGYTTPSQIARYLNETNTPLPSGKQGKWQHIQVQRMIEWVGKADMES